MTADTSGQDRLWLDLVADGGPQADKAVESLFRQYRRPLMGFLIRRGVGADVAEELVQEVFIRMVRGASGFRHQARVSSWLFQIAANLHIDQTRRISLEDTMDDAQWQVIEGTVATQCGTGEQDAAGAEALQECFDRGFSEFAQAHPQRAQALQHAVLHKWSVRDIATFLNRTEGATREFLSQCRKKLREHLAPCRDFLREM
ncbi:RNA polymerase sigma factor [Polaromonas sp. AET17H-212]|jgi:RNA polymerase sigma-70 factor (ECF subfamily)|uniref:RNA polymerase sigma factor n=1 Tax=Polaromonas sp. AET17H-212 TaxID=1977061 RepID=UPI000BBC5924|nr:RNA polymerase sigma factor [Polaromonas sp. AET17H-212]